MIIEDTIAEFYQLATDHKDKFTTWLSPPVGGYSPHIIIDGGRSYGKTVKSGNQLHIVSALKDWVFDKAFFDEFDTIKFNCPTDRNSTGGTFAIEDIPVSVLDELLRAFKLYLKER